MPALPSQFHEGGAWRGWGHWLGARNAKPGDQRFLPFGEALAVARSLGLANRRGLTAWCKTGLRPPSLPAEPRHACVHDGWQGWGRWLGTGNVKPGDQRFLPFAEALALARSLGLANGCHRVLRKRAWAAAWGDRRWTRPTASVTAHQRGSGGAGKARGLPTCPRPQTKSARTGPGVARVGPLARHRQPVRRGHEGTVSAISRGDPCGARPPGASAGEGGRCGAGAARAPPKSPPAPTRSTRTTGGRGWATGWARANVRGGHRRAATAPPPGGMHVAPGHAHTASAQRGGQAAGGGEAPNTTGKGRAWLPRAPSQSAIPLVRADVGAARPMPCHHHGTRLVRDASIARASTPGLREGKKRAPHLAVFGTARNQATHVPFEFEPV